MQNRFILLGVAKKNVVQLCFCLFFSETVKEFLLNVFKCFTWCEHTLIYIYKLYM